MVKNGATVAKTKGTIDARNNGAGCVHNDENDIVYNNISRLYALYFPQCEQIAHCLETRNNGLI